MKTSIALCAWALAGSLSLGMSLPNAARCDSSGSQASPTSPSSPTTDSPNPAPLGDDTTMGIRHALPANDPNIRVNSDTNASDGPILTPPPDKGGPKTRGEICKLHVNNVCSLFVQIYVDGIYAGTIGPYGDLFPLVYAGAHKLYAVAKFDDGTASTWGPRSKIIHGQVTWKLQIAGGPKPAQTPTPAHAASNSPTDTKALLQAAGIQVSATASDGTE